MELAQCLPSYGFLKFSNSIGDYPEPNTEAVILIGNKELSLRTEFETKIQETKFKVTRMRCWRVTTIHSVRIISSMREEKSYCFIWCRMKTHPRIRDIRIKSKATSSLSNIS